MMQLRTLALTAGATLVGALAAPDAGAAPCTSLGAQPIVWIENGDTQEPLVKRLGEKLLASATPIRLVYKNRRTCDLANDYYKSLPIVNDAIPIKYVPTQAEVPGWNPTMAAPTCEADAGGNAIDLAIGATFISSCSADIQNAKPGNVAVKDGPIQAYGFIVPTASSQVALTAEEGYFVFGYADGAGMASPWTSSALRFIRGATASTALTTAAAIGLKAANLKGTIPPGNTSDEVLDSVKNSADPEKTIGLMGTEVYDAKGRGGGVKLLAFKAFKQKYAYFPDSTSASFDKANVRDGHYLPWSPTPYITTVDGAGKATNANVQRILDLVFGVKDEAGVDGLEQVIKSGLVPQCAMKVKRDFDGSNLALYSAPEPCGCYFEAKVPGGATKCATCTGDATCGGGKCRHGYCEAK